MIREEPKETRGRRLPVGQPDYRKGTLYALATATLLALQAPCAAPAARNLNSLDFMALTQFALLFSIPLLIVRSECRRDFTAILFDVRKWPKLAAVFLVGATGLAFYNIGLSSTHPIITAAILNLTPFWGALVAFVVSKRSMPISSLMFAGCFALAFSGAMAIAWSQIDVERNALARDVIESFLHSRWIYALPAPIFFTLGGTLVFKWFSDFEEPAAIAANFAVSSLVLIPVALVASDFGRESHLSEQSAVAVLLLLFGTLASAAAGRVFYQLALTATQNDNGYVSMFFLLTPALTALIAFPLSHWIKELRFISSPGFYFGMALVTGALLLLTSASRQGAVPNRSAPAPSPSGRRWPVKPAG
jgi:drug/metabolite transporter (DMT)-like permease